MNDLAGGFFLFDLLFSADREDVALDRNVDVLPIELSKNLIQPLKKRTEAGTVRGVGEDQDLALR